MDQQTISIIIITLLVVFLIWTYLRRRSTGSPKVDAVEGILKDISENSNIVEEKLANSRSTKKFKTGNWRRFQNKVGFLDDPDLESINEVFTLAQDYNDRTDVDPMQMEKIKESLSKSKKGLSDWLRVNRRKELESKNRGGPGGLFGP